MAFLRDLAPASIGGVPFLTPHDRVIEGPNIVQHRYPGKVSGHYMEPNGVFEPNFHMTLVLSGPNVLGLFERMRSVLNSVTPKTLRHPWRGSQLVLCKHPWTAKKDDRDLGVIEIDATFVVAGSASFPSIITGIAASISGLSGAAIASATASLASSLSMPIAPVSQSYVAGLMTNVGALVQGQFASTSGVADGVAAIKLATTQRG